jgi:acyl-CoA reductase-like NAD-dependent aldehyde dehydrogenase
LLDHVSAKMKIYNEESFGPGKSIIRVNGVDEAARVANDTGYELSAAVFGRDTTRAMAVAERIPRHLPHQRTYCCLQGADAIRRHEVERLRRFGGRAVINEFTDLRWITIEGPQHYPVLKRIWLPASVSSSAIISVT